MTPHAMKIVNLSDGTIIVMKAPDWHVYLYRDKPKVCYSSEYKKFESHQSEYINRWHGEEMTDLPWGPAGEEDLLLQRAIVFKRLGQTKEGRGRDYIGVRDAKFLVAKNIPITIEQSRVLNNIYNLPNKHRVPLLLDFVNEDGVQTLELSSLSIKSAKIAEAEFKTPGPEYKLVNDERKVFVNPAKDDAIDSMSKLLGD